MVKLAGEDPRRETGGDFLCEDSLCGDLLRRDFLCGEAGQCDRIRGMESYERNSGNAEDKQESAQAGRGEDWGKLAEIGETEQGRESEKKQARELGAKVLGLEIDPGETGDAESGEGALEHEKEKAESPFYYTTSFRLAKQIFDAVDAETEEEKQEAGERFGDEYFIVRQGEWGGEDEPEVTFLLDPEQLEGKMLEERGTQQVDWEGFKGAILMAVTKTEPMSEYFNKMVTSTLVMSRKLIQEMPEAEDMEFMREMREFQRNSYNGRIEKARERREIERFYKEAAFGQANREMTEKLVANQLEKFDFDKLMEIEATINEDVERGLELAEDEVAQVLGLQKRPELVFKTGEQRKPVEGEIVSLGWCKYRGAEAPDRIMVDIGLHKQVGADGTKFLKTLMHENWHAWQDERMDDYLRMPADRVDELDLRSLGAIYRYNHNNYIKAKDDPEGYRKQLVEAEALKFGELFEARMQEWKEEKRERERIEALIAAKPEIYTEANREGIEREVASVLTGFDMGKFLTGAGVNSARELGEKLWEEGLSREEFEKVLGAAGEVVRLKEPLKVVNVPRGSLLEEADLSLRPSEQEIDIEEDTQIDAEMFWKGLYLVWDMRQREEMRRGSERGKLYLENARGVLTPETGEKFHRQLLVAEREEFATDMMEILSEQMQLDEVDKMPLPKRVLTKFQLWRKKRKPEMSEKFKVRR